MENQDSLIQAQERTTHAVRAIAMFILILFPSQFIGAILVFGGISLNAASRYSSDGDFPLIIGGLIILAGIVVSIYQGWKELQASK